MTNTSDSDYMPISPPLLLRTVSTQHVVVAIDNMIQQRKCIICVGRYMNYCLGGWTAWYVTRPDALCTDKALMRLITVSVDTNGEVSVFVSPVDFT